ncbi:MarR family winged helix-turn-helix transcriptional regulator [Actinoplanes sp. NPDC049265]|uniref:MarR family winged helix-turn-helix transcriptional regulator n=1 Tax=Actinoplanes sp. NPDC049265 TaxID=3363902 RepID=UPI0037203AE1
MSTTDGGSVDRWLDDHEMAAWLGYRRMRLRLDAEIARDLEQSSGLSMADYDVLSTLADAEHQAVRVGVLASRLSWSQSRLSRQLGRMTARSLVERVSVPGDGRGFTVCLTDDGLTALTQAAPGHVEAVRRCMIDALTHQQLDALASIARTILARLDSIGAPRPLDVD